jgi:WD40 repeat protein
VLAHALAVRAAEKDAADDPLPAGAIARLGTARLGPPVRYGETNAILPPRCDTFLVAEKGRLCRQVAATGAITELGFLRPPHEHSIMATSTDGKRAVVAALDESFVVDVATGKRIGTFKSPFALSLGLSALSADGTRFACFIPTMPGTDHTGEVVVWNVDAGGEVARVASDSNTAVVLAPDGKTLALLGQYEIPKMPAGARAARTIRVWGLNPVKELVTIIETTEQNSDRGTGAFSPDGQTLATAAGRGRIAVWQVPEGKLKQTLLGRSGQGQLLLFAPDGKTLAAADRYGAVERWTMPEGRPLPLVLCPVVSAHHAWFRTGYSVIYPQGLAFADNDRVVVWGALWSRSIAWEVPGGKMLTPVPTHATEIQSVRFAPNGRDVLTTGREGRVVRWEVPPEGVRRTGKPTILATITHEQGNAWNNLLILGPGGARGLCRASGFDPETGAETFTLPAADAFPSPDLGFALGIDQPQIPPNQAGVGTAKMTACTIWNLDTRKKVSSIRLPAEVEVWRLRHEVAAAFSPDNSRLVTAVQVRDAAGQNKTALIVTGWDVKTGKRLGEFETPAAFPTTLAASANNTGAVLATANGELWVADFEKGGRGETIDEALRDEVFRCPTFSPDGKLLAVGVSTGARDGYGARVYAWPAGKALHTFTGHRGQITALAFSPDGKTLASGSVDTTVLLWDLTALNKPK